MNLQLPKLSKRETILLIGWILTAIILPIYLNKSASEANNIAERELELSHRPYITVAPLKFLDTGNFISLKKAGGGMELKVLFKIENTGNSIAKNLRISDVFLTASRVTVKADVQEISPVSEIKCVPKGQNDLTPGESTTFVIGSTLQPLPDDVLENTIKNFESGQFELPINLEVHYESDLLEHGAKTAVSYIIKKAEVTTNYNLKENK
ncbi:MAG: hypothetical protein COV91_05530 [Candidatus Taylorbacteria bacterium CG11_big_fil_rev_8_21_14_0_20_46_11]|uniref:DUF11 domain-containing protein n=1 Tax=Candidatus Taylorbacteria bacterium CG11_big_fil_rev_8_21_14_0_20_46_11 TaxID=1975025 RepID=A0A2H0KA72_9BACT|nr:MAG: hypothetical protein COV91_05530 [Candidatus Taylorbacteria bacterium CG11_big_fil_rev_8_21_14_0_20_46_11]